jgi:nucleotide-binding universal stress UspA family protein
MTEEQPLFQTILVPVDGSQSAMNAGHLAVRLAALTKAQLLFFFVVDPAVVQRIARSSGKEPRQVETELTDSGNHFLDHLVHVAQETGVSSGKMMRNGEPSREIEDLARSQNPDLIVIGQIGRYGLQRVLIGAVTEWVIEHTSCPVMVVP